MKKQTLYILFSALMIIVLTGCGKTITKENNVKIKDAETKSIKFTDFDNGLIKMKVPDGWKVDVLGDYIHYTVKAYNPQKPIYQFYFNGQTLGKKILGIKVVSNDSKPLTIDNYIYRSFIVNSILFNIITFSFVVFASKEVWLVGISVFGLLNYLVLFICLLMIIFNKDGRGLQDLVGNTKVVLSSK